MLSPGTHRDPSRFGVGQMICCRALSTCSSSKLSPLVRCTAMARIQQIAGEELIVQQGSLYHALYRLEHQGTIDSEWGESENNRRAKYYRVHNLRRQRLGEEIDRWRRTYCIVNHILSAAPEQV